MTTLVADLEADGLLDEATRIWTLHIADVERPDDIQSYQDFTLDVGLLRLYDADQYVFHNGLDYDVVLINKLYPHFALDWSKCIDTLVLARLGNPKRDGGHSLAAWGERVGIPKQEHEDWSQWSPEMEKRCKDDVRITLQVFDRLRPMLNAMPIAVRNEHEAAWRLSGASRRGWPLDKDRAIQLASDLMAENEARTEELRRVFPVRLVPKMQGGEPIEKPLKVVNKRHPLHGVLSPGDAYAPLALEEFNPGSRQQVADRLIKRYNWKPTQFAPQGDPQINAEVLRELPFDEAQLLADYYEADKLQGAIQAKPRSDGSGGGWLHHIDDQGRCHARFNSCGTVTGRPTAGFMLTVPRDERARRCWTARPGWLLAGADADGMELRCLAHYLALYDYGDFGKKVATGSRVDGTDVHSTNQRFFGFYARDPHTKNVTYGFIYGAGDYKLGWIALKDAQAAGQQIRYEHLGIRKPTKGHGLKAVGGALRERLYVATPGLKTLSDTVKAQAKRWGKLRGLDGRTLWIKSEHSALNYLLQSCGAILIKEAIVRAYAHFEDEGFVEDRDFALLAWVHDELQCEAPADLAPEVAGVLAKSIVEAGETFGFRVPLAAKPMVGPTWADTH